MRASLESRILSGLCFFLFLTVLGLLEPALFIETTRADDPDPLVYPQYGLPWQLLPQDRGRGQHVRAGRYKQLEEEGPYVPELLVFANGPEGVAVVRNNFDWTFEVLEGAIAWDYPTTGQAGDVIFLDLKPINQDGSFGDEVDDHLLVVAGGSVIADPDEGTQDRLYEITEGPSGIFHFAEVLGTLPNEGPPEDVANHHCQTVISTTDLDPNGTLYLILAGGLYGDKQTMSVETASIDKLRILKYEPTYNAQGGVIAFSHHDYDDLDFHSGELFPGNQPDTFMTDVDVIHADIDSKGDILISCWSGGVWVPDWREAGAYLLTNSGLSGGWPSFTQTLLGGNKVPVRGAAVGDFDNDIAGDEDLFVLYSGSLPPTLFENQSSQAGVPVFVQIADADAIDWQDYRTDYDGLLTKTSYEAIPVEREGRLDTIVVAGGVPYVLHKYLDREEDPLPPDIRYVETSLQRGYAGQPLIPVLANPLIQVYSSAHVLVEDLTGDGVEEIVFSDQAEQNRLWACTHTDLADPPPPELPEDPVNYYYYLEPVTDFTSGYFPGGGALSTRILVDYLYNDPTNPDRYWPDLAVAINRDWSPKIYYNYYDPGKGGLFLVNWNNTFPEDQFQCTPQPCAGGWDGALTDLNGDGMPDLVIAQGGVQDEDPVANSRPDAVYHLEQWTTSPQFIHQQNIDPDPVDDLMFITRAMAAGKLNDDECPDLVFAYTRGSDNGEVRPGGLQVFFNVMSGEECTGTFDNGVDDMQWLMDGANYGAVALIEYEETPGRLPDIIASEGLAGGVLSRIHIFRNYGGLYPGGTPGYFVEDVAARQDVYLGEPRQGVVRNGAMSRFVPMNLDDQSADAPKDDFFVAMKTPDDRNLFMEATTVGNSRGFETTILYAGGDKTWSAAAYDFTNDGYDDIVTFNGDWSGVRVYANNYNGNHLPGGSPLIEITDTFFLDGQTTHDWGFNPKISDAYDGVVMDLIYPNKDTHDDPEILIACDGQNQYLLPSVYKPARAGDPPQFGGGESMGSYMMNESADLVMMTGLTNILPPELLALTCTDWIPVMQEIASTVD